MAVVTTGEGRGEMYFDLHHDVDRDKLISSIRKNRKNIAQIGISHSGKLFVRADLRKLHGNIRAALLELHKSLNQQVKHANTKAKSNQTITV